MGAEVNSLSFSERLRFLSTQDIRVCSYIDNRLLDEKSIELLLCALDISQEEYARARENYDIVFSTVHENNTSYRRNCRVDPLRVDIAESVDTAKYRYAYYLQEGGVTLRDALNAAQLSLPEYRELSQSFAKPRGKYV